MAIVARLDLLSNTFQCNALVGGYSCYASNAYSLPQKHHKNNKYMRTKLLLLSVVITAAGMYAQTPETLSRMFELADRANAGVRAADASVETARRHEAEARAARLPNISASLTLSYLGDGTILDRDFGNRRRDPLPHFSNTLEVSLDQPVYAGGAILGGIDIARQQISLASTTRDGVRNDVRMAVATNYLELVKSRNLLEVYRENIALTHRLIDEMEARYDKGVALRNDITRYRLRLSTLSYDSLSTANAANICVSNLTSLLGLDKESPINTDAPEAFVGIPDIGNEASWLALARANATALISLDTRTEIEKTARKVTHSDYLPKIGIVAGDNFLGPVTFEVPALNTNYNAWFVGVNVKWNISSLFTTNKATRRHDFELEHIATQREAEDESLNRRIHEAYTLYSQAVQRLSIEEMNVRLAQENYEVVSKRFENQLALLTDMLDASTTRLDAGVRLVNARISTYYYYYQLNYIAGTLIQL